jgi:hypothetical protein
MLRKDVCCRISPPPHHTKDSVLWEFDVYCQFAFVLACKKYGIILMYSMARDANSKWDANSKNGQIHHKAHAEHEGEWKGEESKNKRLSAFTTKRYYYQAAFIFIFFGFHISFMPGLFFNPLRG